MIIQTGVLDGPASKEAHKAATIFLHIWIMTEHMHPLSHPHFCSWEQTVTAYKDLEPQVSLSRLH